MHETDAISLDLETLGTDPGDAILSIGMVAFNIKTGYKGHSFYCSFDEQEWLDAGYTARESTRKWWANPSLDKARQMLHTNRMTMKEGLQSALNWVGRRNSQNGLWSRGYMDETMLKLAVRKELGIEDPWHYQAASDARTLLTTLGRIAPLADIGAPRFHGIPHYALDDADHEADLVHCAHRFLATRL